jgi:hypothetical protein
MELGLKKLPRPDYTGSAAACVMAKQNPGRAKQPGFNQEWSGLGGDLPT